MKTLSRFLVVSAAFAAVASANAVPYINVAGNTTGSFSFTQDAGGLQFIGGAFNTLVYADGTSATSLGNSANVGEDSLGLFRLTNQAGSPDRYAGSFSLMLSFTLPTVTPSSAVYTAILTGAVTTITSPAGTNGQSTVRVTFDDDGDADPLTVTKTFSYVDPSTGQTGVLTLALNRQYNIGYPGNTTGAQSQLGISGQLTATATPGPEAAVPMALGALGMLRRRRRAAK